MKKIHKNRIIASFLTVILVFGVFSPASIVNAEETEECHWYDDIPAMLSVDEYIEGEVVVGIDYSIPANDYTDMNDANESSDVDLASVGDAGVSDTDVDIDEDAEEIITTENVEDYSKEYSSENSGGESSELSIEMISDETKTTEEILYELAEDPRVVFAEPNYIQDMDALDDVDGIDSKTTSVYEDYSNVADMSNLQWACSNSSSAKIQSQIDDSNLNPSINVPNFGESTGNMTGDPIVVAVVDLPVDFSNPDLASVAYTFSEQQQAELGCDVHGYNATWQNTDGKQKLWRDADHGTHCAGIIGASWDGKGISGVASNARIVSVQVARSDGRTSLVNVLKGYAFIKNAIESGVPIRVSSNSYGLIQHSLALDTVMRDLGENYGLITVFSAGNSNKDNDYQTELTSTFEDNPYVITVAATDQAGNKASFSSYGANTVTLGAPGVSILSTVNMQMSTYLADATIGSNLRYESFEGTANTDVTITHVDSNGNKLNDVVSAGNNSPRYSGTSSGLVNSSGKSSNAWIEFDFGNVTEASSEQKYFGFMLYSEGPSCESHAEVKTANGYKSLDEKELSTGYNLGNSWISYSTCLPADADYSDLKIRVLIYTADSEDDIYIDSVGVGTKLVPYAFMSGTSMACPMVAGATAVLAAQYRNANGEELANIVKSRVRANKELDIGVTTSGGSIDLGGTTKLKPNPVITDAYLDGGEIVIKGINFRSAPGQIYMYKHTVGMYPTLSYKSVTDENAATNLTWSDNEIRVKYTDSFKGVMWINVGASFSETERKWASKHVMLGRSSNIFEEELTYPNGLGDLYKFDDDGDYDTQGVLQGLGNKLYYIPSLTKVEREPAYKKVKCYDITSKKWSSLPELPEWLANISATTYDKKLIVMGESMDVTGDVAEIDYMATMRLYQFDPSTSKWTALPNDKTLRGQSIINNNNQLYVVGSDVAAKYSVKTGATYDGVNLGDYIEHPSLAAKDGVIYLYEAENYKFKKIANGQCIDMSLALPTIQTTDSGDSDENTYTRIGVLTPVSDGIVLMGPSEISDSKTDDELSDTFILKTGSNKFETYSKRMSDDKVPILVATSYKGKLFAIGTSILDDDERFFRATSISVDEYPGESAAKTETDSSSGSGKKGDALGMSDPKKSSLKPLKWKSNSKGTWVEDSSGWYPKNTWYTVDGTQYYFDSEGYMAKNEWRGGKWIGSNGKVTYKGKGSWKLNSTGWWYEDTLGWYPVSQWQKIDGVWYYFDGVGYMASNEWRDGYWLSSNGGWTYSGIGSWSLSGGRWSYSDTAGWKAKNCWQKINGTWYFFNSSGVWAQ